jgi:hypothetical protein
MLYSHHFVYDKHYLDQLKSHQFEDDWKVNVNFQFQVLVYNNYQLYQGRISQGNNHLEDYMIMH